MPWRHMGEWRYSSTILDIGTRWRWVVSFTPLPLNPRGKTLRYPLDRRLDAVEERQILNCRESKPGRRARRYTGSLVIRLFVKIEVPMAVIMKSTVVWDVMLCSSVQVYRYFGRTHSLHLQDRRGSLPNKQQILASSIDLLFDIDDGDNMSLRYVGKLLPAYRYSHPRRLDSL
jgi:hypothetical protein